MLLRQHQWLPLALDVDRDLPDLRVDALDAALVLRVRARHERREDHGGARRGLEEEVDEAPRVVVRVRRPPLLLLEAVARPGIHDDQVRLHRRHGLARLLVQDVDRRRRERLHVVVLELAEALLHSAGPGVSFRVLSGR